MLWRRNPEKVLSVASLTKIMTALLATEGVVREPYDFPSALAVDKASESLGALQQAYASLEQAVKARDGTFELDSAPEVVDRLSQAIADERPVVRKRIRHAVRLTKQVDEGTKLGHRDPVARSEVDAAQERHDRVG